jgi:ABC-type branched-subunit amino acid transport system permease subunit
VAAFLQSFARAANPTVVARQFLAGLANGMLLFLVAGGLSLIFGVSRIINVAHGGLFMLGAYLALTVTRARPGSSSPATGNFNLPFSATGHPALGLPAGFDASGLPVGIQFVGRSFDEPTLLRVGAAYQALTDWHRRAPPL